MLTIKGLHGTKDYALLSLPGLLIYVISRIMNILVAVLACAGFLAGIVLHFFSMGVERKSHAGQVADDDIPVNYEHEMKAEKK